MDTELKCPECGCEHVWQDGALWNCPECGLEWNPETAAEGSDTGAADDVVRDAGGNVLEDGCSVIVTKDLKVKGSSLVVKAGTRVKNIRLTDGHDGHNIACKISGIGAMNLKSEFVRKA
ncbi:alkylphosphonate utilization protein [Acetobacter musti]|uniref:Alkylphosphonate utilization protein n=1 Tax=Acetobacter musti TaxID=864732 RepID=A0ABX0JNS1_9PROT|nr:zinc ribbon domain-containing protein YjdM [Acetobacter musti]NHN85061.1 alkylphosphonate utilization protein [Acetobacter musti]